MNELMNFLFAVSYITAPILLAALGGMISERSGVVNIGLEGLMCIGGFVAGMMQYLLLSSPNPIPFFGTQSGSWILISIASVLAGMTFAAILAVICVSFQGNQTITGIGMNFIALGLTIYLSRLIFQSDRTPTFPVGMQRWGFIYPSTVIALALVVLLYIMLHYTRFGLRLLSAGENPHATATTGISVERTRYIAIFISGALASLGGAYLVLSTSTQYTATSINGQGFIALATVAFGKWKPFGVLAAALVFGSATTLSVYSNNLSLDIFQQIPPEIYKILPYAATLITMLIFSKNSRAPKALGLNFDVSQR